MEKSPKVEGRIAKKTCEELLRNRFPSVWLSTIYSNEWKFEIRSNFCFGFQRPKVIEYFKQSVHPIIECCILSFVTVLLTNTPNCCVNIVILNVSNSE